MARLPQTLGTAEQPIAIAKSKNFEEFLTDQNRQIFWTNLFITQKQTSMSRRKRCRPRRRLRLQLSEPLREGIQGTLLRLGTCDKLLPKNISGICLNLWKCVAFCVAFVFPCFARIGHPSILAVLAIGHATILSQVGAAPARNMRSTFSICASTWSRR